MGQLIGVVLLSGMVVVTGIVMETKAAQRIKCPPVVLNKRRLAGHQFELLVLKTKNMVHVEQEEAYGDIKITPRVGSLKLRC